MFRVFNETNFVGRDCRLFVRGRNYRMAGRNREFRPRDTTAGGKGDERFRASRRRGFVVDGGQHNRTARRRCFRIPVSAVGRNYDRPR